MATMTITVADAQATRVFTGLSPGDPTAAAAKAVVVDYIKRTVADYERAAAHLVAQNLLADADVT